MWNEGSRRITLIRRHPNNTQPAPRGLFFAHLKEITMRPYLIHCAGLEYTALAPSACMAIVQAMARHGVHGASAKPLQSAA